MTIELINSIQYTDEIARHSNYDIPDMTQRARYRCKMTMVQDPEAGTSPHPPPPLEVRPGSLAAGDGFLPEALVFKVFTGIIFLFS